VTHIAIITIQIVKKRRYYLIHLYSFLDKLLISVLHMIKFLDLLGYHEADICSDNGGDGTNYQLGNLEPTPRASRYAHDAFTRHFPDGLGCHPEPCPPPVPVSRNASPGANPASGSRRTLARGPIRAALVPPVDPGA
jgi:hypothetical protein